MSDPLIRWMLAHKVPITREKYIALNWGSDVELTPEMLEELPDEIMQLGEHERLDDAVARVLSGE